MASGFPSTGTFNMYALDEENNGENFLIGSCKITFDTFVTPSEDAKGYSVPSAATSAGIVLAVAAAMFLTCMYCYCCVKKRLSRKEYDRQSGDGDVMTSFRRLGSDDKATAKSFSKEPINVDGKMI